MDFIRLYGDIIKRNLYKPEKALNLIKFGLSIEDKRVNLFPDKNLPKSFQYLNQLCLKFILEPLNHPNKSAWVNLFAPTEIIHAMDINPMCVEAFSSFLSGLKCEDLFIEAAEKAGISETLCSYHKAFIGAGELNILPKPKFAMTSSMVCDANINTFRHLSEKYNIPLYVIDVPYEYNKDSETYVCEQLKEAVKMIEDIIGKRLDLDKLKEIIKNENQTTLYRRDYIKSLSHKNFPTTLTLEMYMLFTSHIFMGKKETLNFYKMLSEEIKTYDESNATKIFWVHLLPFYHQVLKDYFNLSTKYQLLGCDLNFDFLQELDYHKPYEALAKKMLCNHYNGSFQNKIDSISSLLEELNADAVVNFCHWGCKQSSGGALLLKEALNKKGIPFLSIDGDGIDRRNGHEGQVRTRMEAFLEILEKKGEI